jgi:hypothetical protein
MHCPTQSAALDSSRRHGANRRSGSFQPSFRSRSVCPAIALRLWNYEGEISLFRYVRVHLSRSKTMSEPCGVVFALRSPGT